MANERGATEVLSNVDSAWLRMEEPTNLMTITGLIISDQRIDYQRLKSEIEDRFLPFDRFRQRVVESRFPFVKPRWEEDQHFALRAHLRRLALPHPADQGTLQEMVSELMSTPLDYSKPLWQFHLIENYAQGSAMVARIHHCIADGIALVKVMFRLFDESADGTPDPGRGRSLPGNPAVHRRRSPADEGMEAVLSPARALNLARNGASAIGELGKLIALSSDPGSVFKGKLGVTKRAVWSDPIPLAEVKGTAKRLGATINDLLLTAVSGALRAYMLQRGNVEPGLAVRAVVPVNLRPPSDEIEFGNRFGLVFLALPVGLATAPERLAALKAEMDAIKASPQAMVAFGVLNAMGMASPEIESIGVGIFARKATAVMTNVPGPQKLLYLAGAPIRELMFWVPQSGRLGLGVSILSYNGHVRLGLAVDAGLVPNPGMIVTYFHQELDDLVRLSKA
ncbi:MAG: wax ester/triacylglycerol synthase family O-acyltransferase [Acidobacteria bacterium]|nr:wax ester/triacylglycerol synthase family O-acyltransferase [Acidobacteriota bacterium]